MAAKCTKSQETSLRKPEFRYPTRKMDLGASILEEIAFEGLDGLTLQALFVRLQTRPGFNLRMDAASESYVWEMAKRLKHVSVYLMEQPRADLIVHDRRDYIDERGNMYEPLTAPEDIYDYHPIDDLQTGNRGSCKEYYTRRPYNSVARQLHFSKISELDQTKLVLVAPQQIRERMMMPEDSDLDIGELNIIQYCIFERIARARYLGEMTRGKVSLAAMKIDSKSLFYQRGFLIRKGVITKQTLSMKFGPIRAAASVSLFHLPKFYTYYDSVLKNSVARTIKSILDTPNQQIEVSTVRATIGKHQVRNLLGKDCQDILTQVDISFNEAYPELYAEEPVAEKRARMTRRIVKFFQLRDPRINHINFTRLFPKSGEGKEDGAESSPPSLLPIRYHTTQDTVLMMVLNTIFNSKAEGSSLGELCEAYSLTPLDARAAVRLLQRHKVVIPVTEDKKKTKLHRYVFYKFKEANKNYQKVTIEVPPEVSSNEKSVFIDLQPGHEAFKGEIVWTIPEIGILPTGDGDGPSPSTSQPSLSVKKRRGNSYKDVVTESPPPTALKLTPETREAMERFRSTCDPEVEELPSNSDPSELRFNRAEETDFVPFREPDEREKCGVFTSPDGWEILIQQSDVRPEYGRLQSFTSPRITQRGNYLIQLIYTAKVIIGFQQILRKMRSDEASLVGTDSDRVDVDRRTVYRILRQLQYNEFIQILRVSVQKGTQVKVCALFSPDGISFKSKLVSSSVELIIRSTQEREPRLSFEERKAKNTRARILKKPKRYRTAPPESVKKEKTTIRAKPGTRRGSKIVRKVVKGTRYPKSTKTNWNERQYDETDREALALMNRVRGDWSVEEDRFIITSFLASVLFIPRYNHQKILMFNSHQIRDILHQKLDKAKDKTALAIRRRLHFQMRKNAFFRRYRYYLTEALQDTELYENHLKPYHTMETTKIFFRISTTHLLEVIHYLQKKFRKLSIDPLIDPFHFSRSTSPGTRDHSKISEDETDAKRATAQDDDETDTPRARDITTAGHEDEDESEDSEGDEEETDMVTDVSTVTAQDEYEDSDTEEDSDDSVEEENEDADEEVGGEEGETETSRVITFRTAASNRFCFTVQQSRDCAMVDGANSPFDRDSVTAWTARTAILSLVLTGDDVTNVHKFLSSLGEDVLSYTINVLRLTGLISWQKECSRFGPSLFLKRKLHAHLGPDKYHEGSTFLDELNIPMKRSFPITDSGTTGAIVLISELIAQNSLNFEINLPEPIITINPEWEAMFEAIVDLDENADEGEEEGLLDFDDEVDDPFVTPSGGPKKRKRESKSPAPMTKRKKSVESESREPELTLLDSSVTAEILGEVVSGQNELQEALMTGKTTSNPTKALRLSNKAVRIIRSQINSQESENFVQRDFFTVNMPNLVAIGDREGVDRIMKEESVPKLGLVELKNHLIKVISFQQITVSEPGPSLEIPGVVDRPEAMGNWEPLYDYISLTKEIGVSVLFLKTKFTAETLSQGLRALIRKGAIFLIGVAHRKFVAVEYVHSWTMPVPNVLVDDLVERVVMRPWITSRGTPNWALVDQSLSAVLGYMNLHPDISVRKLCIHFQPVLSAVETMILLDALVGLEFFKLYKLENSRRATPFSPPSIVSKNYVVDKLVDLETLYIELIPFTASKYCKLQELFNSEEQILLEGGTTYSKCFTLVDES